MSGEGSESSSIIKALGHPAAGLLTALVTGLTAGRSGAVSQIGAAALGVVGGVSALAFSLIYGRYSGILASGNKRKTTLERQAYDRLRKSLAEGNGAVRLYAGWLNSFLDWIEWIFGDAERTARLVRSNASAHHRSMGTGRASYRDRVTVWRGLPGDLLGRGRHKRGFRRSCRA